MEDLSQIQDGKSLEKLHINDGEEIQLKNGDYIKVNIELQSTRTVQIVDEEGVWFLQNTGLIRTNGGVSADFSPFKGSIDAGEYILQIIEHGPFPIAYDTRKKYYNYSLYLFDRNGIFQNGEVPMHQGMFVNHGSIGNFTMLPGRIDYSARQRIEGNNISYKSAKEEELLHQNRLGNEVNISLYGMSLIRERPEIIAQIQSYFSQKWGSPASLPGSPREYLFSENKKSIRQKGIVRVFVEKILNDWSDYIEVDTLGKYSLRVHRARAYTTGDIHMMIGADRILFDPKTGTPAKLYINGHCLNGPLKVKWNSDTRMIIQTREPEGHDSYFDIEGNHITLKDPFGIEIGEYGRMGFIAASHPQSSPSSNGTPYISDWKNINNSGQDGDYSINPDDTLGERI